MAALFLLLLLALLGRNDSFRPALPSALSALSPSLGVSIQVVGRLQRARFVLHAKRTKKTKAVAKGGSGSGSGGSSGSREDVGGENTPSMSSRSSSSSSSSSSSGIIDTNAFTIDVALSPRDSKLSPLQGTLDARLRELELDGKSPFERAIAEYTAPTPAGTEPKTVKLMKQVTWIAVIVLVLAEIVVSVKVGGAPFDLGKVSLPSLPTP